MMVVAEIVTVFDVTVIGIPNWRHPSICVAVVAIRDMCSVLRTQR